MNEKKKKNILIIDDDEIMRSLLMDLLSRKAYGLTAVENGMDGLKLLKSETYDLIITDISMPFVSGLGVIDTVKKTHPHTPVIAITGFGEEAMAAAKEKAADMVIGKPFMPSVIIGHIEKLLSPT